MLRIRLSRRELGVAALGVLAPTARAHSPRAKSVILLDLFGGPSHLDTFDPKPDAPAEIRGEFGSIPTPLPGVRFTEHLPELARRADRFTLIRTVSHEYNSHNPYAVMTGFTGGQDQTDYHARPTNHPSVPSVCQYLGVGRGRELPGYVMLPAFPGYTQGLRRAGPYGGYLGPAYDPVFTTCTPTWHRPPTDSLIDFYDHTLTAMGSPALPTPDAGLTLDALDGRRELVELLDDARRTLDPVAGRLTGARRRAFDLLTSAAARRAFDLTAEPPAVRDRYGRDLFGQSVLLARRLAEAGVPFVTVHTEAKGNGHWDTHENNFRLLKHALLPFLDRAVSVLFDDLRQRGLADDVLVVVNGDMGRTPRINAKAGRDHWPRCGFALLYGAGVKRGHVHGRSDRSAAFPVEHPVTPGDLCATVYQLMGVDPEATVPDHTGRPIPISHGGSPVRGVLA